MKSSVKTLTLDPIFLTTIAVEDVNVKMPIAINLLPYHHIPISNEHSSIFRYQLAIFHSLSMVNGFPIFVRESVMAPLIHGVGFRETDLSLPPERPWWHPSS